jgi:hypothetical protein
MEFKRHWPDDLSADMTCSNKHISADEETDEMREVAEILVALAQSFCKDSIVHVSSLASNFAQKNRQHQLLNVLCAQHARSSLHSMP